MFYRKKRFKGFLRHGQIFRISQTGIFIGKSVRKVYTRYKPIWQRSKHYNLSLQRCRLSKKRIFSFHRFDLKKRRADVVFRWKRRRPRPVFRLESGVIVYSCAATVVDSFRQCIVSVLPTKCSTFYDDTRNSK